MQLPCLTTQETSAAWTTSIRGIRTRPRRFISWHHYINVHYTNICACSCEQISYTSKMQAIVLPKPSTLSIFSPSTTEAFTTLLDEIIRYSRVSTTTSRTTPNPENGKMPESRRRQRRAMNPAVSRSANGDSHLETVCETMLSGKCRKACENVLLVLVTVTTMCVCTLPTVIYFTSMVSMHAASLHNNV